MSDLDNFLSAADALQFLAGYVAVTDEKGGKAQRAVGYLLKHSAVSSNQPSGPNERIKQLEKAIRDANDWLNVGEGVDLTYYALDSGANGSESWKVLSRLIHESAPTLDARDATGESDAG
jgi:hypothetical protein